MVWEDPTAKPKEDPTQYNPQSLPSPTTSQLPPISSYGQPGISWNKETMELLVDIEIPKDILAKGQNEKLFIWTKKCLMQLQFGNYTEKDYKRLVKDLWEIIWVSQQEGNEQIAYELQLMFISKLQISKGRSDKPDGLRERTMWIMQMIKNIFQEDQAKRPEESASKWHLPFMGPR